MSAFLSAIFIFWGHILWLSRVVSTIRPAEYYNYSIIVDTTLDSHEMWPQKMKMALRKALVSIFSAQFFENKNTWNTTLVS